MAGNTKLTGFLPDNGIQIERWGKKAQIILSEESIQSLRSGCYELPTRPPQQNSWTSFQVKYDEMLGRVMVGMSPASAEMLADLLESLSAEKPEVRCWITDLREGVQAHIDYHNMNEPGVLRDEEDHSA